MAWVYIFASRFYRRTSSLYSWTRVQHLAEQCSFSRYLFLLKNRRILVQTSDFSHDDYAASVVDCLNEAFPNASCTLDIETPFRLCIRAIMSAQCTDKKVNIVSKELFKKYPTPKSMDTASEQDIAQIIKPCGMHAKKSYYIKSFSILFENEWAKEVPRDVDILMKCPGIGRKIANLMVGEIYGIPAIVVDTHCKRVAGRMGLSSSKNPAGIE